MERRPGMAAVLAVIVIAFVAELIYRMGDE